MQPIPWLDDSPDAPILFPPPHCARHEPNGLLAAGGRMTPEWLLAAYRQGIFPWFSEGDPILWWSLNPRMVLVPSELRLSRSLRRVLKSGTFEVRYDTAFREVMQACAAPRADQDGTWIVPAIINAYSTLHELGWAHSVEAWQGDKLVGGLYGVAIGHVFYGESMFHRITDASKVAFAHLVHRLHSHGFALIDCQMNTRHLASLGAREIPREDFQRLLAQHTPAPEPIGKWQAHPINWTEPTA